MPGAARTRPLRRSILPIRIVRNQPRLFTSIALSILVYAALTVGTAWRLSPRILIGWDVGVAFYLILAFGPATYQGPAALTAGGSSPGEMPPAPA